MKREIAAVQYANALAGKPFAWGVSDCYSVVLGGLRAITGLDVDAVTWSDEAGARDAIADRLISARLADGGMVRISPADATVGDVLIAPGADWPETAYFCLGSRCLSAWLAHGVTTTPTRGVVALATSAWRWP